MAQVEINQLSKFYGRQPVVEQFSLQIQEGEFVALLGPSGCGKTTVLRMVAGLERPDQGSIQIAGQTVSDPGMDVFVPPEKRHLGMVFQSYAIWPHLSVFENVAFPLRMKGMDRRSCQERVDRALDLVELQGLGSRQPSQLSGGQQQRVALARALVAEPQVLLLDEPLSNLDAKLREKMRHDLRHIQRELQITVLYVTHDQLEAVEMSDRMVIMNQGRILQVGPPLAVKASPQNEFVRDFLSRR